MSDNMMVSEVESGGKRKGRWYQVRIRTLLLLTAAIALCLGYGLDAWRRHQALDMIRDQLKGNIFHRYPRNANSGTSTDSAEPDPPPQWLRAWVGEELFDDVFFDVSGISVGPCLLRFYAQESSIDDAELRQLGEVLPMFKRLEFLEVVASEKVTDAGLGHLAGAPKLTRLDVTGAKVTGTGIRQLASAADLRHLGLRDTTVGRDLECLRHFPQLQILDLGETDVTDDQLLHLSAFSSLQRLMLDDTGITDSGVSQLSPLQSLEMLSLRNTKTTDESLRHLAHLPALHFLNMENTRITGSGLGWCCSMHELKELNISDTLVGDRSLAQLKGQCSLDLLDLSGTRVTDAGLAYLEELPALTGVLLDGTEVTDKGVRHLLRIRALRWVSLKNTRVTDAGIEEIRNAFPECQINR